jgi:outer membrane receptor protein involved in Fe transport
MNWLLAQPPAGARRPAIGKISGSVFTKNSENPIEYAAISLVSLRDSSIVTGTITNQDGIFIIEHVPVGRYRAKVSFIGFKPAVIKNVNITMQKPEIVLGSVYLEPTTLDLSSVTVTGQKKALEYNLDKKIVTIDNSVATVGGTATDIMETIPSVTVDIDGNVSLRGSSSVTLLVDGRPSQIISLDEIPASLVDRVEIVTNPSARYDPEGMAGIINIVLKKKRSPGYNGMVLINAGTGDKYNGSINLNYRHNKINFFTNYDTRFGHRTGSSESNRQSIRNDSTFYLDQSQESRNRNIFHNFKFGSDYFINDFNTLSATAVFNWRTFFRYENRDYLNTDYRYIGDHQFTRLTDSESKNNGQEFSLNYKKTFSQPQREWTMDLFYSNSTGDDNQENIQSDSTTQISPELENIFSDRTNRTITIQTDYVHPLGEHSRFETGYKSTFRHTNSDYRKLDYDYLAVTWISDSVESNHFIYDENIHAFYGIYSREMGRLQSQLGLRIEQAMTSADLLTLHQSFSKNYFSLFPTIHFRYLLTEAQGLGISYSRRIHRPHFRQITPFIDYADPYNLYSGNPNLKPEYIDVAEIEHSFESRKTTFSTSLFYRQVNGMITRLTDLQDGGVTFTTYKNLNNGISYGLESVLTQRITPWWRVNTDVSYFHNQLSGTGITAAEANKSHSWSARINSFFRIGKNTEMQAMFFYFSPSVGVSGGSGHGFYGFSQGRTRENYFLNLGAKHNFMDDKISVFVRVSDLLQTQKHGQIVYGDNFKTTSVRYHESPVIFFGVSFKINEGLKQREKKTEDEGEDLEFEEM